LGQRPDPVALESGDRTTMILERLEARGIGFKTGPSGFRKDRPTLVMLHGAGGSSQTWLSQVNLLPHAVNALALDLPGHGETEGTIKETLREYGLWVTEILESVIGFPVFLMGHSMGGAIALDSVISRPDLFEGLILAATGARLRVAPAFLEGLDRDFEGSVDTIIGYAYAPGADPTMVREGAILMKAAGQHAVLGDFSASNRFDRRGDLSSVRTPCLIVCGDRDQLTPPSLSEYLQTSIQGSELKILPGAGHMVMIERFKEFNQAVMAFIQRTHAAPSSP
jgi:pimeloyl-ACP methyl ester carboxylesterase